MPPTTSRELAAFLEGLAAGVQPAVAELSILSDLDRSEASQLAESWQAIPEEIRERVIALAAELAEDNVDLAFAALAKAALSDPSASVRMHAAETLWESDDRGSAAELRRLLRCDEDEPVRAAAAQALNHFVVLREFEQFDRQEGDAIVHALRETVEDDAESVTVRGLALEALGVRSLGWVANLVIDAYNSDDRRLRIAAIHAMGESADERWLEYIHEQFYSDDSEFRFEAVVAAAGVGSEDSVEPLLPLLEDEDSQVVIATAEALGEIGGPEALSALKELKQRAPEGLDDVIASAIESALEGGMEVTEDDDVEEDDAEW